VAAGRPTECFGWIRFVTKAIRGLPPYIGTLVLVELIFLLRHS